MNPVSNSDVVITQSHPVSIAFEDKYYSAEDGVAESKYVFLKHNFLEERWKENRNFCIAELGFGTGLNFFVTAEAWSLKSKKNRTLYYYSVERFPLALNILKEIHSQWPQYQFIYEYLHQYYPDALPGLHRIEFGSLNIVLCLMIGDVVEQYSQVNIKVDAWFLDGFSPAKNQAMWTDECFILMSQLSNDNATFATFTSAGFVRRGLAKAGFEVNKAIGFGKKREMIYGRILEVTSQKKSKDPWFSIPRLISSHENKSVAVIGAGLAGISTAWLLACQGVNVILIEKNKKLGEGASGNPCGLVMPRFNNDFSLDTQFYYTSVLQTVQWLSSLKQQYPHLKWCNSGVIQLLSKENISRTLRTGYPSSFLKALSQTEVTEHCGLEVGSEGLLFPMAGYVSPRQLCEILIEDMKTKIDLRLGIEVSHIEFHNDSWKLFAVDKEIDKVDAIVVANSFSAESLMPGHSIKIEKNRGQLSILDTPSKLHCLKIPLVYDAYLTPVMDMQQMLGASYAPDDQLAPRIKDHERNIQKLQSILNEEISIIAEDLEARVSFRAYSQDRMPIVGPVHKDDFYYQNYGDLHHGKKWAYYPNAEYIKGLYVNIGHGSRGLVSSLPSSRFIAELITGQPLSSIDSIISRIHPARFLVRQLKKPDQKVDA